MTICKIPAFHQLFYDNCIYEIEGDRFYVGEESLSYQDSFIRHYSQDSGGVKRQLVRLNRKTI